MIEERLLAACVRSANFYTPLIKRACIKAAHGREAAARHQLSEAIRHARDLLTELQGHQLTLGWGERDGEAA
jgi:hypothetical protein